MISFIIFLVIGLGIILAIEATFKWGDRLKEIFMTNYSEDAFKLILIVPLVGLILSLILEQFILIIGFLIFSFVVCYNLYGKYEDIHVTELIAWHFALALSSLFIIIFYMITKQGIIKETRKK